MNTGSSAVRDPRATALEILEREERASPVTSSDRRRFLWLNAIGYGIIAAAWVVGFSWGLAVALGDRDFSWIVRVYVLTTLMFSPGHVLVTAIELRFNLRLVRKIQRRKRVVRELGLEDVLTAPWRAERKKRWLIDAMTLFVAISVPAWGTVFAIYEAWPKDVGPDAWAHPSWWVYLCTVHTFVMGFVYLQLHWLRQSESRLAVVNQLRKSLGSDGGGTEDGSVSSRVVDAVARIERAQIFRERAQSIKRFDASDAYVVQKSRALRSAQSALEPGTQMLLEDRIDALAGGPPPDGKAAPDGSGAIWVDVPNTSLGLELSVDESARRIRVLSLRPVGDGTRVMPEEGE